MRRMAMTWMLLVVMLVSVGSIACGEKVKLNLALGDPQKTPQLDVFLKQFMEAYPDIELEVRPLYGGDSNKLTVEMVGGVGADVYAVYNSTAVLSIRNGFNMDLTPYIKRDNFQSTVNDFLPATMKLATLNGHIYGFPQYQATGAMYYNPQYFAEAGLSSPNPNWTWEDFLRYTQKLTRMTGDKVTVRGATSQRQWLWLFPWLVSGGVKFDDPYSTDIGSPAAVKTAEFLNDLKTRGYFDFGGVASFLAGKAAMTQSGSWELNAVIKSNLFVGAAAPPKGAAQATMANTDFIAINKDSKHPEEAWTFLKWFYGREVQRQFMLNSGLQPARLSLGTAWVQARLDSFRTSNAPMPENLTAFVTNSNYAMPQPFYADVNVTGDIAATLTKAINGDVPAPTALASLAEVINQKLKEFKK